MKLRLCLLAILFAVTTSLSAQDIAGSWQGTLGKGKSRLRVVLQIEKGGDGGWTAQFFSIDESPDATPLDTFMQKGPEISFSIPEIKLSYKGTLSADGNSIVGRLTQGGSGPFTFVRATPETAWPHDIHCSCSVSFVPVEKDVKVEVLDWGGTGRPLILLAGLGDTAHVFDDFAHKLAAQYHVYGITRRGFGDSSAPPPTDANYNADRLGEDVLAVIDALKLKQKPVLAGHSIAGEELSSVGSRHPEKVAGLVYLDAAYGYAFYNPAHPDFDLDVLAIRKELDGIIAGEKAKSTAELLARLPAFERELQEREKQMTGISDDPAGADDFFGPSEAILFGEKKYTEIKTPILAIFASPHNLGPMPDLDAAARAAEARFMKDHTTTHIQAFEAGLTSAKVVIIPNADHYVFQSNESEVLREMNGFIAMLPR
jgi:non-heme chloroperoxidase